MFCPKAAVSHKGAGGKVAATAVKYRAVIVASRFPKKNARVEVFDHAQRITAT